MSSTKVKDRQGKFLDFYETPIRAIDGLFSKNFIDSTVGNVLEPCAGSGAIVSQVKKQYPLVKITAIEIQDRFSEELGKIGIDYVMGNFLETGQMPIFDRIVANPPFSPNASRKPLPQVRQRLPVKRATEGGETTGSPLE